MECCGKPVLQTEITCFDSTVKADFLKILYFLVNFFCIIFPHVMFHLNVAI